MTALVIIIYNRLENLKRWAYCLTKVKRNFRVYVIHNSGPHPDYKKLCQENDIFYIPRKNIGMDIGAFQDLCRGRIQGFADVNRIMWVTDDVLPMSPDFMDQYTRTMQPGVGVACMQISTSVRPHIRTTAFMIDLEIARRLVFAADPIINKHQCYLFEHRDTKMTFAEQVRRMGLSVQQVAKAVVSPLWDTGYHKRLDRRKEHEKTFGITNDHVPPITFISTIYDGYPMIIPSLLTQTFTDWKLLLIHDGPNGQVKVPDDPRISYIETPERKGNYGHYIRQEYLQKVYSEFVVITNNDNYYVPDFIKLMIETFDEHTVGVYPSQMVHSYFHWKAVNCKLELGHIDCGAMMLRATPAKDVGWNDITTHSADWIFFNDLIKAYGVGRFKKREGALFIHN